MTKKIKIFDLSEQYNNKNLSDEIDKRFKDILHSGQYILGKNVKTLEKKFALILNAKYAEIICDKNHVSEEAIKIAHKCIPGLYAISDAISSTGLDDGTYNFAGAEVQKKNNKVYHKPSYQ